MPEMMEVQAEVPQESSVEEVLTPEAQDVSAESPDIPIEEQQTDEPEHPQLQAEAQDADGRVIPQKYRDLFKTDKDLKNAWFTARAIKTEFPGGLVEARKYRDSYQAIGGEEGLQAIEAERSEWQALDQQYSEGDPRFIQNIAAESPESFVKLMPAALEQFAKLDPETYSHNMARVVDRTLENANFPNALAMLAQNAENPQNIRAILEDMKQWFAGVKNLATNVPQKKIDPERQKLEQEKQSFAKEKQTLFQNSVASDVNAYLDTKAKELLGKHLSQRNIDINKLGKDDPESVSLIVHNINQELAKVMVADKVFKSQFDAIMAAGDKSRAVKAATAKMDRALPEVVKKVYNSFYRFGGGKTADNQARANGAAVNLGKGGSAVDKKGAKPADGTIDWNRTTTDMVFENKAFVKGQKDQVSW